MNLRRLLILGAFATLATAVMLGLARMGLPAPASLAPKMLLHGPLMVCGFLGLLISLERAVALEKAWGYGAPALCLAGSALALAGSPAAAPAWLFASLWMLALGWALSRRGPSLASHLMLAGVGAWALGNLGWVLGAPWHSSIWLWAAFPILLIVGERLELAAHLRMTRAGRNAVLALSAGLGLGAVLAGWKAHQGSALVGFSLLGLCAWLFRFDFLSQNLKKPGEPRFLALTLSGGYAWIGIAGLATLAWGHGIGEFPYDAALHAVFVGFVLSMIYAHAPVIFPSVGGIAIRWLPSCYLQAGLLHLSLMLRLAGDFGAGLGLRQAGAWVTVASLLAFAVNNILGIAAAKR